MNFRINYKNLKDKSEHYDVADTSTTIVIGTQMWTTSNLRATRLNDGTPISFITDIDEWGRISVPAYCWYNNNTDVAEHIKYGALYNWYAVNTGKLAPKGWHIPTNGDWTQLNNFLRTNNKTLPSSSFGGLRYGLGNFYGKEYKSYWWGDTRFDLSGNICCRTLSSTNINLYKVMCSKNNGFSVRLVKNV